MLNGKVLVREIYFQQELILMIICMLGVIITMGNLVLVQLLDS